MYSHLKGRFARVQSLPVPLVELPNRKLLSLSSIVMLLLLVSSFASTSVMAAPARTQMQPHVVAPANTAAVTYKSDINRTGQYNHETILTPGNVNAKSFGKLATYPVDGQIYAQPLYVPNVVTSQGTYNLVFVATEHDGIYAFNADAGASQIWYRSLINPTAGITTARSVDIYHKYPNLDINPEVGITGTPVIDPTAGTMYLVALTVENGTYIQRLHALSLADGSERPGSPVTISASVKGTGAGSLNGMSNFLAKTQNQRGGLLLLNGVVYIPWGAFGDTDPYHGWVMGYNATTLQQVGVFNDTPNGSESGVWQAGSGLAADSNGNIYFQTGNGDFDLNQTGGTEGGDSILKLSTQTGLALSDYFAPFNQDCLKTGDLDLGSGGVLVLPTQTGLAHPDMTLSGGKEGRLYLVDQTNMGKYTSVANPCSNQSQTGYDKVLQELPPQTAAGGIFNSPAYWTNGTTQYIYIGGTQDRLKAFTLSNGQLSLSPVSQTPEKFSYPGMNVVTSSSGTTNGIVWSIVPPASCAVTDHCNPSGSSTLRAYDATNLNNELYSTSINSARDGLSDYVKFTVPTIANGEVFVGSQNSISIYGLINGYNNIGTSDDSAPQFGNYDGGGASYSAQALASAGFVPGQNVTYNGATFTWPNVASSQVNNYQATGQTIPVTPVSGATTLAFLGSSVQGSTSGAGTIKYSDGSTQNFTLGLTDWATSTVAYGNRIVGQMSYRNISTGKQYLPMSIFYTDVALQPGLTVTGVTLPVQGNLHVFAVSTTSNAAVSQASSYNNIGISDDTNPKAANMDGSGYSYSAQALQTAGILPGRMVIYNNVAFTWPNVVSGVLDNYQANGQTVNVPPMNGETTLAFLGTSVQGASTGTGTLNYTDGTTASFTLGFTDWANPTLSYNNRVVSRFSYRNGVNGRQNINMYLFYADVPLASGKTLQSIILPIQKQLHIFSVGTSSPTSAVYNNAGISDDKNNQAANFDHGGYSYSAEAMQQSGLLAGVPVNFNNVHFTWPNTSAGTLDDYEAHGQTVAVTPVNNATTLAFLGASSNGGPNGSSGTCIINYTDGTSQSFPLGLTDWGVPTASFGNKVVTTMAYRNGGPTGRQNINVYIYYTDVTLQAGKTIANVKLPTSATNGLLHIFAIGTK